jgi:hypothetical protein
MTTESLNGLQPPLAASPDDPGRSPAQTGNFELREACRAYGKPGSRRDDPEYLAELLAELLAEIGRRWSV